MNKGRALLAFLLLAGFALFFVLDGQRILSLGWLQASRSGLIAHYTEHPVQTRITFFLLYLGVASLSIPGAVVLTLAGGAVMGFAWGLLLVSFASSIGATVSLLCVRFLLRDALEARFSSQSQRIHAGLAQDGALYLFGLRLIPVVPFFAVNIAMGLTHLPPSTFYWVSQLGMLPSTALYVNAGTQLANLQSIEDIANAELLVALALLGLFPFAAKGAMWGLHRLRQQQKNRP